MGEINKRGKKEHCTVKKKNYKFSTKLHPTFTNYNMKFNRSIAQMQRDFLRSISLLTVQKLCTVLYNE
jgi:hypothetical protein